MRIYLTATSETFPLSRKPAFIRINGNRSMQHSDLSMIDPFLYLMHEMLKKRVAEAELEMAVEHLGPAAHEITAGCHRQAEEISAVRRTYAETLKRRIAFDLRNLHKATLVPNAYYCNLVAPAMSILISGNVDEYDVDALVEETICGAQSAKRSKKVGAASKVALLSGSAQTSSAQVVQTQAFQLQRGMAQWGPSTNVTTVGRAASGLRDAR